MSPNVQPKVRWALLKIHLKKSDLLKCLREIWLVNKYVKINKNAIGMRLIKFVVMFKNVHLFPLNLLFCMTEFRIVQKKAVEETKFIII